MVENRRFDMGLAHNSRAARITGGVSEKTTGIPVPESTINKWCAFYTAMSIVDDRLDDLKLPEQRQTLANDLRLYIEEPSRVDFSDDPLLLESMERVRDLSLDLPEDRRRMLFTSLKGILSLTEKIREETNPKRFSALRRLEGQLTASALAAFIDGEQLTDPSYPKLLKVFKKLGRATNSIDSVLDLKADYDNGEVAIEPSIKNRAILIREAFPDGIFVFSHTKPSREVYLGIIKSIKGLIPTNYRI